MPNGTSVSAHPIAGLGRREEQRWLLLMHQIPAQPAYVRVKTWRRLQSIGAVAIKNAVHVLPASEQSQEDFEWLRKDIIASGGEAVICEARLLDGLSDDDVRALFNTARNDDYAAIAADIEAVNSKIRAEETSAPELKTLLASLKKKLDQTAAIDFFKAGNRRVAESLLQTLHKALSDQRPEPAARSASGDPSALKQKTWVTRTGVHVDRIACAWLVRRFIDQGARFKFVPGKGYSPQKNEVRFDMAEAEFTHEGDRCSFETLLTRLAPDDPALNAIAEIVHDIDLKDDKFGREETGGIKALINGICASTREDMERIARGSALFDNLYTGFARKSERKQKQAAGLSSRTQV